MTRTATPAPAVEGSGQAATAAADSANGSPSPSEAVTDGDGLAATTWTPGDARRRRMVVTTGELTNAFRALATADPPVPAYTIAVLPASPIQPDDPATVTITVGPLETGARLVDLAIRSGRGVRGRCQFHPVRQRPAERRHRADDSALRADDRPGRMPGIGVIVLDEADIGTLESDGVFEAVVTREMARAMGSGQSYGIFTASYGTRHSPNPSTSTPYESRWWWPPSTAAEVRAT